MIAVSSLNRKSQGKPAKAKFTSLEKGQHVTGEVKKKEEGVSLVDQRTSVFDNDEFDVFRRKEVDFSRVHIGKRSAVV